MQLAPSIALASFVASSVEAFSPAFLSRHVSVSTRVDSTLLEESPTTVPSSSSTSVSSLASTSPQPTRFDRIKKNYKGVRPSMSDHDISFSYDDFAAAVADTKYSFERNSVVAGVAVEYAAGGCLIDIGAKAPAFLPEQEAGLDPAVHLEDTVPLDTTMDFQIISEEDENGQLLVSIRRLEYKKAWARVVALYEQDATVEAPVAAINRGGAICMIEGLRAFLPGSHLTNQLPDEDLIGQTLKLKFLEVNTDTNKIVVSNRKAVVEEQMTDLSRGDVVAGMVKALKPYGAFIEVGGISGLLHISQISADHIGDLEQVLQPGMQIKCMILDHDKVNGRIALSTKTLEPEPGDMLKDPQAVFDNAEESAAKYHQRMEEQRQAREGQARDIVMGLGDSLDDLDGDDDNSDSRQQLDPLQDVSDSLDSLLS